jgi:hypothetical protein
LRVRRKSARMARCWPTAGTVEPLVPRSSSSTSDPQRRRQRSVAVEDRSGVRWRVYERVTTGEPGARRDRCLIFDSDSVVRRVWNYPPDWWQLPQGELLALSGHE